MCSECFDRGERLPRPVQFIINGQGLCQTHSHLAVRERHSAVAPTRTWPEDENSEPMLECPAAQKPSAVDEIAAAIDDLRARLCSAASVLETDAMNAEVSGAPDARLKGKAEGVRLAASYLYDADRMLRQRGALPAAGGPK